MASKIERLIIIGERLIATGRTRLLATLVVIGCLTFGMYIDRSNAIYYAGMMVVALAVFLIVKSISDIKEGPAHNGQCKETNDKN